MCPDGTGPDPQKKGALRASIIIPTYHRPDDLRKCLASVLAQTVRPFEVVVVDDGALEEVPLKEEYRAAGIPCIYHRKETPGLTASRNKGVALAGGDIVFFLDDDVVLKPSYIEEILGVYGGDDDGSIGGVGGIIDNTPPFGLKQYVFYGLELLFLLKGLREGRRALGGGSTEYGSTPFPLRRISEVDFLAGGVSSWRREVCRRFPFSEEYVGYGLGEDKDYSFRVGREYRLLVNPAARLSHYHSPVMRYDKRRRGRELVVTKDRLYRTWRGDGPVRRLLFWYSLAGFLLITALAALFSRDRKGEAEKVMGIAAGIRDLAAGRPVLGKARDDVAKLPGRRQGDRGDK